MAAKVFNGTWITVKGSEDGYEEFMDAIGSPKMKELFRGALVTMTFEINGDDWKTTASVDAFPGEKVYKVTVGKPFSTTSLTGEPVEAVLLKDSDNKVTEKHKSVVEEKQIDSKTERIVNGDIMDVITYAAGKEYKYKMQKTGGPSK